MQAHKGAAKAEGCFESLTHGDKGLEVVKRKAGGIRAGLRPFWSPRRAPLDPSHALPGHLIESQDPPFLPTPRRGSGPRHPGCRMRCYCHLQRRMHFSWIGGMPR